MSSSSDSMLELQSSPEESTDSEPLPRISQSPKPKISLNRMSPIASSNDVVDSNRGTRSSFTFKRLNRVASLYPWPKGVTLCLPVEKGDSMAKYPDCLVVHEEALKAGFRLPALTFVRDFLRWTELCPAQISPNSWRCLSAYGIRCWEMNKEPTFVGMQYLFDMRIKWGAFYILSHNLDIVTNPTGLPGWKNKWFLVKKGDGYDFDFPIHPGIGVKFSKGVEEMKDIPVEGRELRDAFLSLEGTNPHHSQLVTHENLENAGLSLPHPRQSMKPGLSSIKFVLRKQNGLNSSGSVEASKKRTLESRSPPEEDVKSTKKRLKIVQFSKAENIVTTPVQNTPKSPSRQLCIAIDSPPSLEERSSSPPLYRPNYLASSVTLEEANELLKGATVNVDAVSILKRLPDVQDSAEFARDVALQVYHANKLIEKHEKLLLSHLGSHAKLEGLQEENKELNRELLCAKESAKENEESMKKQIQSLEDNLRKNQEENADNLTKTQEENAELRQKIMEGHEEEKKELKQELFCAKESAKWNEESMKKQIQSLEDDLKKIKEESVDNLKKIQEENAEIRQKITEGLEEEKKKLEQELLCAKESAKRNEESMKQQIQSLEDDLKKTKEENADNLKKTQEENANNLKKTQEENAELCQKIMEGLEEEKKKLKQELLYAKESAERNDESMKKQIQSLEDDLKKIKEESADNLKKTQEENDGLRQKIMEGLEEEKKELKKELLCAKESTKQNEESMKKQIQSLEDDLKKTKEENADKLKKTQEANAELHQKIIEGLEKEKKELKQELLYAHESAKRNEESTKKHIQSLEDKLKKIKEENADNLKKTQEENAELRQKIMEGLEEEKKELKQELLCAKGSAKLNEESLKKKIQSLDDMLKKTKEENAEQRQTIMQLKMDESKAKGIWKEEFINSKGFYRHVAHFNATYYMSGVKVGVCQAVNKYQHLDPKIVEFEPDFDDDCGYDVPDPPPYSSPIRLVPYPSM